MRYLASASAILIALAFLPTHSFAIPIGAAVKTAGSEIGKYEKETEADEKEAKKAKQEADQAAKDANSDQQKQEAKEMQQAAKEKEDKAKEKRKTLEGMQAAQAANEQTAQAGLSGTQETAPSSTENPGGSAENPGNAAESTPTAESAGIDNVSVEKSSTNGSGSGSGETDVAADPNVQASESGGQPAADASSPGEVLQPETMAAQMAQEKAAPQVTPEVNAEAASVEKAVTDAALARKQAEHAKTSDAWREANKASVEKFVKDNGYKDLGKNPDGSQRSLEDYKNVWADKFEADKQASFAKSAQSEGQKAAANMEKLAQNKLLEGAVAVAKGPFTPEAVGNAVATEAAKGIVDGVDKATGGSEAKGVTSAAMKDYFSAGAGAKDATTPVDAMAREMSNSQIGRATNEEINTLNTTAYREAHGLKPGEPISAAGKAEIAAANQWHQEARDYGNYLNNGGASKATPLSGAQLELAKSASYALGLGSSGNYGWSNTGSWGSQHRFPLSGLRRATPIPK